jgi:HlyD family secretion protein
MKRILFPILGIVFVIITVVQVKAMRSSRVAEPPHRAAGASKLSAEGRVVAYPGFEVTVGSDVAGTIERVPVKERDSVRKGDVLAVIRADDTRAALAEAKAKVGEADADIRLYELESERWHRLFAQDVGSKQAWEKSERDLDAARARRASSQAEVHRLEATLAKTVITSPIDGAVITRSVDPGQAIGSNAAIATVADLGKTRIEAEVDEFDAGRVAPGSAAVVTAEGYDQRWRAHVEEVPDAVVYRRLKPQDTSKPTDTRVLLVKIALDEATPLKLGQRVEVSVATSSSPRR